MTITLFLNDQAEILRELLELYLPGGGKIIDLTYGKGSLLAETQHYGLCDVGVSSAYQPSACHWYTAFRVGRRPINP